MNNKKFIVLFCILTTTFATIYSFLFILQFGPYIKAEYWLREVKIVKNLIFERSKHPGIVLLSGSNSFFGFDSQLLERYLETPVVNCSTHGGFPIEYLLFNTISLKKQDTIILPLEYLLYSSKNSNTKWFTDQVIAWENDYFYNLNFIQKIRFITAVPVPRLFANLYNKYVIKKRRESVPRESVINEIEAVWKQKTYENGYNYKNVNPYGDIEKKGENIKIEDVHYSVYDKDFEISDNAQKYLKLFIKYCRENSIRVFASWPCVIENEQYSFTQGHVKNNVDKIKAFYQSQNISIIGEPTDFSFPKSYFYDTMYHLNNQGKKIRSLKIAELMLARKYSGMDQETIRLKRNRIHQEISEVKEKIQLKENYKKNAALIIDLVKSDNKEEALKQAFQSFDRGNREWTIMSLLFGYLAKNEDTELSEKLFETVCTGNDIEKRNFGETGDFFTLGLTPDSWTLNGDPAFIISCGNTGESIRRRIRVECHAKPETMPLTVTIENTADRISHTFHKIESVDFTLPGDSKDESRLFMITTDKTWIPEGADNRRLGVRVHLTPP